ncbi:MAG TPA: SCP2 sterol-binding domain-containing protein [Bacillales bacterium]|nr:SCP2 sterol-binding domain-containing protein [Bacillales bacterium]
MNKTYNMDEVFANIEKRLQANPDPIEGMEAVYQFDLSGDEIETYQLHLSNGKAWVGQEESSSADCLIKMKQKDFMEMLLGRLNGTTAFMTGKLKVKGSMGLAMKLQNVLGHYEA